MSGLNVVALISGGKDSLFSILHCLANGHKIVALANLYPEPQDTSSSSQNESGDSSGNHDDLDEDTNSYMYQTVGHSIIPLYAEALGLPLYREPITGTAVNTSKSYHPNPSAVLSTPLPSQSAARGKSRDETESLLPLLQRVLLHHPNANALSTGAILSTYQRTRIESIAGRLNLVPLAYLWQYPYLPPYTQASLLTDMAAVGQESRIIKVASGGLDESHLWMDLRDPVCVRRLGRDMSRFGLGEVGAVLGEGGEFETLAVDGPSCLWKGRIDVPQEETSVMSGDGGSAVLRMKVACVVMKEGEHSSVALEQLRIPRLWDEEFERVLAIEELNRPEAQMSDMTNPETFECPIGPLKTTQKIVGRQVFLSNITSTASASAATQMQSISDNIRYFLSSNALTTSQIALTTILLRSMTDFADVNTIYGELFVEPNPPARVTIASGECLQDGVQVMVSIVAHKCPLSERRGLHVQSRSYWAPANIGPYSQAVAVPLVIPGSETARAEVVHVAGQIPLIPASMEMISATFTEQAILSLQHLWRIGKAMNVHWWANVVVFITGNSRDEARERAMIAGAVWSAVHALDMQSTTSSDDEDEDIGNKSLYSSWAASAASVDFDRTPRAPLPNMRRGCETPPPCVIVQIEGLPRGAQIEWSASGITTLVDNPSHGHGGISTRSASAELFQDIKSDWVGTADVAELYLTSPLEWETVNLQPATVIPCRRVFDSKGRQYIGASRRRSYWD